MAIQEGDDLTPEEHASLLAGMIRKEVSACLAPMSDVPPELREQVIVWCVKEQGSMLVADFIGAWRRGRREFPELADEASATK